MNRQDQGEVYTCGKCRSVLFERNADGTDSYCQDCSVRAGDGQTLDFSKGAVCAECCDC